MYQIGRIFRLVHHHKLFITETITSDSIFITKSCSSPLCPTKNLKLDSQMIPMLASIPWTYVHDDKVEGVDRTIRKGYEFRDL